MVCGSTKSSPILRERYALGHVGEEESSCPHDDNSDHTPDCYGEDPAKEDPYEQLSVEMLTT